MCGKGQTNLLILNFSPFCWEQIQFLNFKKMYYFVTLTAATPKQLMLIQCMLTECMPMLSTFTSCMIIPCTATLSMPTACNVHFRSESTATCQLLLLILSSFFQSTCSTHVSYLLPGLFWLLPDCCGKVSGDFQRCNQQRKKIEIHTGLEYRSSWLLLLVNKQQIRSSSLLVKFLFFLNIEFPKIFWKAEYEVSLCSNWTA